MTIIRNNVFSKTELPGRRARGRICSWIFPL